MRNESRAGRLDPGAQKVVGDLTRAETLADAVAGIDAVVFTHSERLVRASGNAYTIVRPGWFDSNNGDQLKITPLQGDTRHAGSPADGVIARHQIARVLWTRIRRARSTASWTRRTCPTAPNRKV